MTAPPRNRPPAAKPTPPAAEGYATVEPTQPPSAPKVQAALANGLIVQSDWQPCPLGLDGLDLLNRNTLTFTLLADAREGLASFGPQGQVLRIADCVLLVDVVHGRYLSVALNQAIRSEGGATLVLPEKTLRAQPGTRPTGQVGWLSGHGAFVGATMPR